MSDVRRRLRRWAYAAGYIESELDAAVDGVYRLIAHELAEKQRAALEANPGLLEHELIDLIDPKKEGQ